MGRDPACLCLLIYVFMPACLCVVSYDCGLALCLGSMSCKAKIHREDIFMAVIAECFNIFI